MEGVEYELIPIEGILKAFKGRHSGGVVKLPRLKVQKSSIKCLQPFRMPNPSFRDSKPLPNRRRTSDYSQL